jgi:hypothetical protein
MPHTLNITTQPTKLYRASRMVLCTASTTSTTHTIYLAYRFVSLVLAQLRIPTALIRVSEDGNMVLLVCCFLLRKKSTSPHAKSMSICWVG